MEERCKKCMLRPQAYIGGDCTRYKKYGSRVEDCGDFVVNKSQLEKLKQKEKEADLLELLESGFEAKYNVGDTVWYLEYGDFITETQIRDIVPYKNFSQKFGYKVKGRINPIYEESLFSTYKDALVELIKDKVSGTKTVLRALYKKGCQVGLSDEQLSELRRML